MTGIKHRYTKSSYSKTLNGLSIHQPDLIMVAYGKVVLATLKEQQLDDESLNTFMCEVESVVNGRPITKLSDDPRDNEPLTPNHLLLLRSGSSVPPSVFCKQDGYGRRRWRQVQYMANVLWRRWLKEYLPSLQRRQKWSIPQRNFVVNDVVLVLDENKPRLQLTSRTCD